MNLTFKDWMLKQFDRTELQDISKYGCISGFSGLIYYSETTKLYQQYKSEIWSMLADDTESFGCDNIMELIASFQGSKDVGNGDQFENLLVWYAAEKIALELSDHNT